VNPSLIIKGTSLDFKTPIGFEKPMIVNNPAIKDTYYVLENEGTYSMKIVLNSCGKVSGIEVDQL